MFAVEVAYIITAFILPVLSTFLNPVIYFPSVQTTGKRWKVI